MTNSGYAAGHTSGKRDWGRWKGYQRVRTRRRLLLIAALLLLLAGLLTGLLLVRGLSGGTATGAATLTDLTADRIREIRCRTAGGETAAFSRGEDGLWESAGNVPAAADRSAGGSGTWDQEAIGELAASLTGVRLYQTIRGVTDPSQYGLDEPACTVTITDAEGEVTEIAVGDLNETVNKLYCTLNGDQTVVYVVSPALTTRLSAAAADYVRADG